jgi:hypothetical protein
MKLSRQLFSKKDPVDAPTREAPHGFAPEDRKGAFNGVFQHFLLIETSGRALEPPVSAAARSEKGVRPGGGH